MDANKNNKENNTVYYEDEIKLIPINKNDHLTSYKKPPLKYNINGIECIIIFAVTILLHSYYCIETSL